MRSPQLVRRQGTRHQMAKCIVRESPTGCRLCESRGYFSPRRNREPRGVVYRRAVVCGGPDATWSGMDVGAGVPGP